MKIVKITKLVHLKLKTELVVWYNKNKYHPQIPNFPYAKSQTLGQSLRHPLSSEKGTFFLIRVPFAAYNYEITFPDSLFLGLASGVELSLSPLANCRVIDNVILVIYLYSYIYCRMNIKKSIQHGLKIIIIIIFCLS